MSNELDKQIKDTRQVDSQCEQESKHCEAEKVISALNKLWEEGYTQGAVVKIINNWDTSYGILTGEVEENSDGIVLVMTDGRKFLADFCTLIEDVNKDGNAFRYVYEETVYMIRRVEERVAHILHKNDFGRVD